MAERTCTIDGCEYPLVSSGLCRLHYNRARRNGSVGPVGRLRQERLGVSPRVCSQDGCERGVQGRGLCVMHYHRLVRCGDPGIVRRAIVVPYEMRFWSKVDKTGSDCGCWLWMAALNQQGYGVFNRSGAPAVITSRLAHRVAYELVKGPIPDRYEIDHLCRNPRCVNPDHLEAVTGTENRRRIARGVCRRGHELRGNNVGSVGNCLTCRRELRALAKAATYPSDPCRGSSKNETANGASPRKAPMLKSAVIRPATRR